MLRYLCFGFKWRSWIRECITSTCFVVMINGGLSKFFKTSRGLWQGDPFSPLLFIIVVEALNKFVIQAQNLRLLRDIYVGKNGHQIEFSYLLSMDDTLFLF